MLLSLYVLLLLFSLSFTYCENSEIKVTVKLTRSTVYNNVLLDARHCAQIDALVK